MTLRDRFESISAADVRQFIQDGQEENLGLEFKELSDNAMNRNDRKNLAKALSGFANSAGGLLVWGVEARPDSDKVDRASAAKPVANAALLVSRLNELTGSAVSPIVDGVEHKVLTEGGSSGFAVTFVPESDSGLHMAKQGEDRYYKRSGDSFYKMEHYDVADMFGRRKRPHIELVGTVDSVGFSGTRNNVVSLLLTIVNSGRGTATAPFLWIDPPTGSKLDMYGVDGNHQHGLKRHPTPKMGQARSFGSDASTVIHPGSSLDVTRVNVSFLTEGDFELSYRLAAQDIAITSGNLVVPKSEITKFAG